MLFLCLLWGLWCWWVFLCSCSFRSSCMSPPQRGRSLLHAFAFPPAVDCCFLLLDMGLVVETGWNFLSSSCSTLILGELCAPLPCICGVLGFSRLLLKSEPNWVSCFSPSSLSFCLVWDNGLGRWTGFYICATEARAHPCTFIKLLPLFFLPTLTVTIFPVPISGELGCVSSLLWETFVTLWNLFTWYLVTWSLG